MSGRYKVGTERFVIYGKSTRSGLMCYVCPGEDEWSVHLSNARLFDDPVDAFKEIVERFGHGAVKDYQVRPVYLRWMDYRE